MKRLLNYNERDQTKVPILISLEMPKTLVIGLLVFDILAQLYLIFFSFRFSKREIAGDIEDIENTVYFDHRETMNFFNQKFISLFLSTIVLLLITQNPTVKIMLKIVQLSQ